MSCIPHVQRVLVPTEEDETVKEYIRMRDDQKKAMKIIKQQILAFVLRHGYRFEGGKNYWTLKHTAWLKSLKLGGILQETLDEYLVTFEYLTDKIERLDKRIEELASCERYQENVKKLSCLIGVKTHTALSVLVEIGDFKRFAKAEKMAAFLGLVPGEDSSGGKQKRGSITKAGNSHGHHRKPIFRAFKWLFYVSKMRFSGMPSCPKAFGRISAKLHQRCHRL